MRYHINTYWKGTARLADSEGFASRAKAAAKFRADEAYRRKEAQEEEQKMCAALQGALLDESTEDPIRIMDRLTLLPGNRYDYRVEACEGGYCIACLEAGLLCDL